jgi:hypothetical protein
VKAKRKGRGNVNVSIGRLKLSEKNRSVHYFDIKIGLDIKNPFVVLLFTSHQSLSVEMIAFWKFTFVACSFE